MSDSFEELKKFEQERRKGFRRMMGASVSFNVRPTKRPDPVEMFMKSYLGKYSERFRSELLNGKPRNTIRGFIISIPHSQVDTRMLGITYYDRKDSFFDEDLWEATHSGLMRLSKITAEQRYPEYKGYHHEAKKYFGHPIVRWAIIFRDFVRRLFKK